MEKIKNILETITKAHKEIESICDEFANGEKNLIKVVEETCKTYTEDMEFRKLKIKEQVEIFEMEKAAIKNDIEKLKMRLVTAVTNENKDVVDTIQKEISEKKVIESTLDTQINMLYSTPITGDDNLFLIAKKQVEELVKHGSTYDEILTMLHAFAEKEIEIWKNKSESSNLSSYIGNFGYVDRSHAKTPRIFQIVKETHDNGGKCIERAKENKGINSQNTNSQNLNSKQLLGPRM